MSASKKKQGVKRKGKARGQNLAQYLTEEMQITQRTASSISQIMEQEFMLIALKRMGILGPKRLLQLNETLLQVRKDYSEMALEDDKYDKTNEYTKGCLDRELKTVLGDEYFMEWDERHDLTIYTTGIRPVQLLQMKRAAERREIEQRQRMELLKTKNGGCI